MTTSMMTLRTMMMLMMRCIRLGAVQSVISMFPRIECRHMETLRTEYAQTNLNLVWIAVIIVMSSFPVALPLLRYALPFSLDIEIDGLNWWYIISNANIRKRKDIDITKAFSRETILQHCSTFAEHIRNAVACVWLSSIAPTSIAMLLSSSSLMPLLQEVFVEWRRRHSSTSNNNVAFV